MADAYEHAARDSSYEVPVPLARVERFGSGEESSRLGELTKYVHTSTVRARAPHSSPNVQTVDKPADIPVDNRASTALNGDRFPKVSAQTSTYHTEFGVVSGGFP